ncbi:hypothetical protein B0I35DRAFT_510138 [Stachybotrys elegans]|uniref:Uncharacterized protein n=1 Tax=Stachybotrys elegans TaxID=80388 RepID=A0A8K0WT50_9HYPO|nr:hypothetical protein B0I35DRAFT_510138 [Stachybotrys elegans]
MSDDAAHSDDYTAPPPITDLDLPPSYSLPETDADDILPPASLHIDGCLIRSSDPSAPPLYQTSHAIVGLSEVSRQTSLERLDPVVRTQAGGAPQVTSRPKSLYHLKHYPALWLPKFPYFAEPVSRQTYGTIGLVAFHPKKLSTAKGYRVHRAAKGKDRVLIAKEVILTASPGKDAVMFEWVDGQDRLVAREVKEADNRIHLVITAEMGRKMRDMLVVAWMLRIWWELAEASIRPTSWEDVKRKWNTRYNNNS